MQYDKLRNVRTASDFRRAVRPNYATAGREIAACAHRQRPFSRSYLYHVMNGDYAPSGEFVVALAAWFAEHVMTETGGRVVGVLSVNGRWSVSLVCANCGRKWHGTKRDKCRCEIARRENKPGARR